MVPADADNPEQRARRQIDAMLRVAGWDVQDRAAMNLAAAPGVAVREFQTNAGPADYLLFLGNRLVGVVEEKAENLPEPDEIAEDLRSALEQIEEILGDLEASA